VLLVDDEPDLRRLAEVSLAKVGGFQVIACDGGEAALQEARAQAPAVVLLDVQMPGLDGPQTLARLRALPGMAAVPVLFLTATQDPLELSRLRGLDAQGIVHKPFDPFALPGLVRAALGAGR
jgi:two-component system, OmpR family, response regulator